MSARLEFRDAVARAFQGKFAKRQDIRVHHENGSNVDMNSTTVPVVAYEIVYRNSRQADLSDKPRKVDTGEILITVLVKELSGVRSAIQLRDEAAELLERSRFSGASTSMASLLPNSHAVKGWVGYRAVVPFWHYHF
ncbi:hypothetical protein CRG49_000595 [Neisseria sp. N95_16]|uniref:DUF3168 domain-containing protein n=1 Tax=Neisseria brasiliensis TaxID=2666100 RepID=A0A7X2GZ48_9NEIS|nr:MULTISPECIES: hypothetical protein [Neisseria]MRN38608.1 hypothetical protein [Neisseria brasiliensis]PJO10751.1 hypothetical protein CRG49_000595 [Neisseria sp. N95_16]